MHRQNTTKFLNRYLSLCIPILIILLISTNVAVVWKDAKLHDFVPCAENCGESFGVFKYVQDYNLYGFKYGLIEDNATDFDANRTPYLYTHNANLPGMIYVILDVIGLKELYMKQLFTLFIHGLGLVYLFIAVSYLARSKLLGIIVLSFFCIEYEFVFNFALNPLRAWHWLALFGLIYHTSKLVLEQDNANWLHKIGVFVFSVVAFGLGYDFFFIALAITMLMVFIKLPRPFFKRQNIKFIIFFASAAIFPFIIRQIQIIYILGAKFWVSDLLFSIVTKITFLKYILTIPSNETIANYFLSVGVYRPVTTGPLPLTEVINHLKLLIRYTILPITGLSTLLLTSVITIIATVITIFSASNYFKNIFNFPIKDASWQKIITVSHLIVIIAGGSIIGIAIFPQHNMQIYIKHLVPLIAASFFIIKGSVICLLLYHLKVSKFEYLRFKHVVFAALLLFIIADHLIIQKRNILEKQPYEMTWISEIKKRPHATYAVSWMPTAISVFTNNDVVSLSRFQQEKLLQQLRLGREPFEQLEDYTVPLRTRILAQNEQHKKPDYWLYFSTDNMSPFDHPTPNCRLDYLSEIFNSVVHLKNKVKNSDLQIDWIKPDSTSSGDYVVFSGRLKGVHNAHFSELSINNQDIISDAEIYTNCQKNSYVGLAKLPSKTPLGSNVLSIKSQSIIFEVKQSQTTNDFNHPTRSIQLPMPSAKKLISENPHIPIAARGNDWVLFDLRSLYL